MTALTLTRPDDWHLHLRDGALLNQVAQFSARQFARALVMPNLKPPICRVHEALQYRSRIQSVLPKDVCFEPYFSLYLTETSSGDIVQQASKCPHVLGFKLYPAGATTHSEAGVTQLERIYPILEALERCDLVLQVHGEVTDSTVDIYDRERVFIERELIPLTERFPALRIVLEHVTTREGVDFVRSSADTIAATITAHHLLYNRNDLLAGCVRPHYYCLPVLKRETHRQALLQAAISGNPKFFLGTDSAPHQRHDKESACGCAGCFTAPAALELYAEAFESMGAMEKLQGFASEFGADFYRLPKNSETITLRRQEWQLPESYREGKTEIVPLRAGQRISWQIQ